MVITENKILIDMFPYTTERAKTVADQVGRTARQKTTFCPLVPCGDCGKTTKETYLEILEFTHFVDFFSVHGKSLVPC